MISIVISTFFLLFSVIFWWYKTIPKYRIGNFPSPPGYFFIGHTPYLNTTDKTLPYIHRNLMENGGCVKIFIGLKVLLCTSDNEFLRWILNSKHITKTEEYQYLEEWLGQGLILSTGQHWKLHRKILTPAFHFKMVETHISALRNTITILIEKLQGNIDKSSIDIYPLVSLFALDAVCESTLATSINAQKKTDSTYTKSVQSLCRILYERSFDISKMYDFLFKLHKDYKVYNKAVEDINVFTIDVIKKRREILKNIVKKDVENIYERRKTPFIDILLNAVDENNSSLSDRDILEEVNTTIFAGYETTASAISFTLYNLAQHPDIQTRAFEEQRQLFGSEKNPFINYSDLNNMKYLEMVIKESLRLFPPIPLIGRKILEDSYYDGKLLPKGLSVLLCFYTLHRNPEIFPEPEKFDPSRFENEANMTYSFLPFSAGQRNCIGQKFAMVEIKQTISTVLRNCELLPVPGHILKIRAETSLKSSNGIYIRLKKREY